MGSDALKRLRTELAAEGGLLAAMLSNGSAQAIFGGMAAAAPRSSARAQEYATVLEAILEGYLMHYGTPRLFRPPDEDMQLLGGDLLYAHGLATLGRLGNSAAVKELADLISLCARLQIEPGTEVLVRQLWCASAAAVFCAAGDQRPNLEAAKQAVRAVEPGTIAEVADALEGIAECICAREGLESELAAVRAGCAGVLPAA